MNDLPRHTLARIIAEHGREICAAPKRVEALLRDLCGAHRREINIIVGALEEHVAADLISAAAGGKSAPREVLLARQAARLRDNLAYTPEAALWAVETWAFALGILSATELQERERTKSAEAVRITSRRSRHHRQSRRHHYSRRHSRLSAFRNGHRQIRRAPARHRSRQPPPLSHNAERLTRPRRRRERRSQSNSRRQLSARPRRAGRRP
jgi:hypothetical protein